MKQHKTQTTINEFEAKQHPSLAYSFDAENSKSKFMEEESYNINMTKQDLYSLRSILLRYLNESPAQLKKLLQKSLNPVNALPPVRLLAADIEQAMVFIRTIETVLGMKKRDHNDNTE